MSDITCPHCKQIFSLDQIESHKLEQKTKQMEADFQKKMKEQEEQQRQKALKWKEEKEVEMNKQLEEEKKKREISEKNELELRKKQQELVEREKRLELDTARAIEQETQKQKRLWEDEQKRLITKTIENNDEQFRRKELEYKKQQEQMNKTIDDLRRKAQQGSMQIQGDIQEDDLRDTLRSAFPIDTIEDVPTGIRGADILQTVRSQTGQSNGVIIWESKNTKTWSDEWITKLKADQMAVQANFPILVSVVLPKDVKNFALINGVWVTQPQYIIPVTTLIRNHLQSVSLVRASTQGKDTKMEALYGYLSGDEFRMKIESIVEAFTVMKQDLDTERRAMERIWKKREKQLNSVMMSTSGMYGDLQGIIGSALSKVSYFELESGEEEDAL